MLVVFAVACVIVPGLFWWGTTFINRLDDAELLAKLRPEASEREVQHAAEEISRRFEEGRPGMDRWAGLLVEASERPEEPVRVACAWAMQYDARRALFQERLASMLDDSAPMVARNAATSLARGGDASGRAVLRDMLIPHVVRAPGPGRLEGLLDIDQPVHEGDVVARVLRAGEAPVEVRATLPGRVLSQGAAEGEEVAAGQELLRVSPAPEHVLNAAAALLLVGTEEDLAPLGGVADQRSGFPEDVRRAARAAVEAIRARE